MPDWSRKKYIGSFRSGSYTFTEDGYALFFGGASNGLCAATLNGCYISYPDGHDSWSDFDTNFLPICKGDYVRFSGSGSTYYVEIYFIPFK